MASPDKWWHNGSSCAYAKRQLIGEPMTLTPDTALMLETAFTMLDRNGDKKVSKSDFLGSSFAEQAIGVKYSASFREAQKAHDNLARFFGKSGDFSINFEQFVEGMKNTAMNNMTFKPTTLDEGGSTVGAWSEFLSLTVNKNVCYLLGRMLAIAAVPDESSRAQFNLLWALLGTKTMDKNGNECVHATPGSRGDAFWTKFWAAFDQEVTKKDDGAKRARTSDAAFSGAGFEITKEELLDRFKRIALTEDRLWNTQTGERKSLLTQFKERTTDAWRGVPYGEFNDAMNKQLHKWLLEAVQTVA